jgi:hypothetical protein
MSTSHIVSLLIEERDRIEAAIAALRDSASGLATGKTAEGAIPDWVKGTSNISAAPTIATPKRKAISAEARRRMAAGQKRRYAEIRAAKTETVAPKVSKKLADVIAPAEDAEFKAKMSIAMAKSWAKRKAAAK